MKLKTIGLAAVFASQFAFAAEGDTYTRYMQVEKLADRSYLITCNLEFPDTNRDHTYNVALQGGGTNQSATFPFNGLVNRKNPRLELTGNEWTLDAVLKQKSLKVTLVFHYRESAPDPIVYCQSAAFNVTTGTLLSSSMMFDVLDY